MKKQLAALSFIAANFLSFQASALQSTPFEEWLADVRKDAIEQGISANVVESALKDVTHIDKVISLDRKQPEHKITLEEYLEKTVTNFRIEEGKRQLEENRELLTEVSRKYAVPAPVIVALWGMETSYGENTGNFNLVSSLATLAYDGRRSEFFHKELINALKILDAEKMESADFVGSWAGAFGQCQFMPSSFLRYAVDYDNDGKRDIWFTQADVFASIANYLKSEGWNEKGTIEEGSNNFKVLMKWNRSRYFATAIGQLVNAIGE